MRENGKMRRKSGSFVAAAVLWLAAGPLEGAEKMTRLNVAVMDLSGNAAEGVSAADLLVTDRGKPERPVFVRRSGVQPVLVLFD